MRETQRERERETDRDRETERQRERDRETERERERDRETERERERDRERETERQRERQRERERQSCFVSGHNHIIRPEKTGFDGPKNGSSAKASSVTVSVAAARACIAVTAHNNSNRMIRAAKSYCTQQQQQND